MNELDDALRRCCQATALEPGNHEEEDREAVTAALLQRIFSSRQLVPQEYSAKLLPPKLSRHLYMQFYSRATEGQQAKAQTSRTTMTAALKHGPVAPLKSLKRTTLKEVARRVNYIHSDLVLFLSTSEPACMLDGALVFVEDDCGDCIPLSLRNFVQPDQKVAELLPSGMKLALLAPYMKNMEDDLDEPLELRCDNPQCIVRYDTTLAWEAAKAGKLPPSEPFSPASLKKRGNEAFQHKRLDLAFRYYSRAVSCPSIEPGDRINCLSNRALVSLGRQQWEQAANDAQGVLSLDSSHVKAKYRLAKAFSRLGKVDEALVVAKELLVAEPANDDFKSLLGECEISSIEHRGEYDLERMRKEQAAGNHSTFHADYVSAKAAFGVDILLRSGETYRGCRALQDIDENELICASKAMVYVKHEKDVAAQLEVDVYSSRLDKGSRIKACSQAVALLYSRPSLGRKLYRLSAGPAYSEVATENVEKIDIPRIQAILASNVFGTHDESLEAKVSWKRWKRVQEIHRPLSDMEHAAIGSEMEPGTGLWLTESMFNHSCVPNCTWQQIGDHIFIRSTRPISSGEELSVTYVPHQDTYSERVAAFGRWGTGFECKCEWCHTIRTDHRLRKMVTTIEEAHKQAANLVTAKGLSTWGAAERVLPSSKRVQLLSDMKQYSPHLQHIAGANLRIMHGACLAHAGNHATALAMYEEAAAITYAVRGSAGVGIMHDLWRIAAAAMKCGNERKAVNALMDVWKNPQFAAFSSVVEAQQAFKSLTYQYGSAWFGDKTLSPSDVRKWTKLARDVCENKSTAKSSKATKRRKGRK
ncbi:hypothetical protein MPSEU_000834100 [Mayamaea pseudoterrestris]|nr:hypothetical protein MPSEU_000834100 [Mayamaea pseudoterrestris]